MMRKVAFVLALSLAVTGGALGNTPSLYAGGGGPPNPYDPPPRDALWSEPPDLNGMIASSEIISDYILESEIANDFVLTGDTDFWGARWWGGYYNGNGCGDVGYGTNWNLRFYNDGGCVPSDVIAEYLAADAHETSIGCQAGFYPLFEYQSLVNVFAIGGNVYWFGAQAGNHTFPPQVGRLTSTSVINCESVFKSAFFGFPDWVPALYVFGVDLDFSQEFNNDIGVPTQKTTWGAVKGLYR